MEFIFLICSPQIYSLQTLFRQPHRVHFHTHLSLLNVSIPTDVISHVPLARLLFLLTPFPPRVFDRLFTGLVEDCCRHGKPALDRLQHQITDVCEVKKFTFDIGDNELIQAVTDATVKAELRKRVTWGTWTVDRSFAY